MIEQGYGLHTAVEVGALRPYYKDETPIANEIPLYKPHGSTEKATNLVGEGGLVITQFDYIEMLNYRAVDAQSVAYPHCRAPA